MTSIIESDSSVLRPQVLLAGFFGRGNCGDEALLQCIYEALSDEFEVCIAVDEHGAYPGFWDWYPYNQCKIVHQCNYGIINESKRLAGVIVGGGGLPAAFCAGQALQARIWGIPTALVGTDCMDALNPLKSREALRYIYGIYDLVSPRHANGASALQSLGVSCLHGGDWALRLKTDSANVEHLRGRTFITVRELPANQLLPDYSRSMTHFVRRLRDLGHQPCFLPFCPEDVRFLKEQDIAGLTDVHEEWANPRRMQQIIGTARLLISIGRLHPLIFAANAGTPAVHLKPEQNIVAFPYADKVKAMCEELSIQRFDDAEALFTAMSSGANFKPGAVAHQRCAQRLQETIDQLKQRMLAFASTRVTA
jgi:polysaccharide pyruvyl transferase WcaK-like protein